MEIADGFKIEISSSYERFWCYNTAVTCGCFDSDGNRTGFASAEDRLADVGADMKRPPSGYCTPRTLELSTVPCSRLLMYIYVIPHTLPEGRDIADSRPFPLRVLVRRNGATVLDRTFDINSWSGASIELAVGDTKKP